MECWKKENDQLKFWSSCIWKGDLFEAPLPQPQIYSELQIERGIREEIEISESGEFIEKGAHARRYTKPVSVILESILIS